VDVWAAPVAPTTEPIKQATTRWRQDLPRALAVAVGCVLLGAPAGLLWSKVAPRLTVTFEAEGPSAPDLESTKAFIGADGSYLLVMLGVGLLCGAVAWLIARRSGPWTVAALAVGGALGALVAARVGVLPGSHEAVQALQHGGAGHPPVDLYLGKLKGDVPHLRAPWAAVAWPVGALLAFLVPAAWRPEDLD
jgi:hypothetical protein